MNKPFFIKEIFSIDDTYKNKLIDLFDCDYNNRFDHLHNRKYFFKDVDSSFILHKFNICDEGKFINFLKVSDKFIFNIKTTYGKGKLYNLQIAKLKSKGKIPEHIDRGLFYLLSHRIHVPLITNQDVIFSIGGNKYNLRENMVYEVNNSREHSVINKTDNFERVHLILDYVTEEYFNYYEIIQSHFNESKFFR